MEVKEKALKHELFFEQLRAKEYARLDEYGHTYLDYTGGMLFAKSQVEVHHKMLLSGVFGNPHSTNPSSMKASGLIEESRRRILDFFNADDYYCIFTANASGALKIVGESYPFGPDSDFLLFSDDHNSVNGIREFCKRKGGRFSYVPIQFEDLRIDEGELTALLEQNSARGHHLFAFPAQSNVSGVKHNLSWIEKAQKQGWDVLLDAAAFVPTNALDLKKVKPDFVSISFYKIFGYPTGLGCLLVRKEKFDLLEKPWFAGGTVSLAAVMSPNYLLAEGHERFEDGTLNYLDIPALKTGIDFVDGIGMKRIQERIHSLIVWLYHELVDLKHSNGNRQVHLFGPNEHKQCGGTLIMNFFSSDGEKIPFEWIEDRANERMISIRSGCFCNPGLDEVNNCITTDELAGYFSSRDKGDYHDMIQYLHKMRGATRISVGIPTVKKDLLNFIAFVKSLQNRSFRELRPF